MIKSFDLILLRTMTTNYNRKLSFFLYSEEYSKSITIGYSRTYCFSNFLGTNRLVVIWGVDRMKSIHCLNVYLTVAWFLARTDHVNAFEAPTFHGNKTYVIINRKRCIFIGGATESILGDTQCRSSKTSIRKNMCYTYTVINTVI
jgi:hypothetical protein